MRVAQTPEWAAHPDLIAFYSQHRSRPDTLYPSERRFLPWLARQAASVLDAGCATGGFCRIWRHYRPDIEYTGLDIAGSLIDAARKLHPGERFLQGNVAGGIELPDDCATVVQALGWLHWELDYRRALAELWRLTGRYLFFDVRLLEGRTDDLVGRQQLALSGPWDGRTTTPYIAVAWRPFAARLLELAPSRILSFGYRGWPAGTVIGIDEEVCFATFVLEKAPATPGDPAICVQGPLSWPTDLAQHATVLPAARLDALVPAAETMP